MSNSRHGVAFHSNDKIYFHSVMIYFNLMMFALHWFNYYSLSAQGMNHDYDARLIEYLWIEQTRD
jgi:hypothetical protein